MGEKEGSKFPSSRLPKRKINAKLLSRFILPNGRVAILIQPLTTLRTNDENPPEDEKKEVKK